ncbi:brefeldin A resistance protein [Verticillium dahliae]|nr:brefeldin A resistance protein [Verticillium dahliae]
MADKAFEKAEEAAVDGQNLNTAEHAVAGTNAIPDEKSALKDDKSSVSTANDPENAREEARRKNPDGFTNLHRGISVEQAEADFAELQRELSGVSRASRVNSRRKSHGDAEKAIEAASSSDTENEQFDLEGALRGGLDAEREAGIRPKHIGVIWDGLTVKGIGGTTNYVQTFPNAVINFFDYVTPVMSLLGLGKKGVEATLLDNFRGVCEPGEMVLVLGKPGSGCTTFLKTIANQRYGYTGVTGDVSYGPFTAKEFKQYRGEAVYNQEDDIHHSTRTVEQTLGFALDTKAPNKRPGGMTKNAYKEAVITTLLKMFNIEHTRNTVVGDAFVRGVSGGERKRVSIAEMMITNACVLSWDNSTRGLDASTALDFVKSLRVQTNLYKTSTLCPRCTRLRSISTTSSTRSWSSTVDSRSSLATIAELAAIRGAGLQPPPSPDNPRLPHWLHRRTLVEAFKASNFQKLVNSDMDPLRLRRRFHLQVWALMKAPVPLKLQDRLLLTISWIRSIVIAIVLGTLFYDLGATSASAFSKGGLIFILSSLWIAQIIVDQAFAASQIMVFLDHRYFMTGLPRFDYAIKFAVTLITFFVVTSGYIIQYQSIPEWIRWIYWINALGLAFGALMENEFSRIDLTCSAESLIPSGPGTTTSTTRFARSLVLPPAPPLSMAPSTLRRASPTTRVTLWRNFGVIVALIVGFLILNVLLGEIVNLALALTRPRTSLTSVPVPWWRAEASEQCFRLRQSPGSYRSHGRVWCRQDTLLDVLASRKNIGVIGGDVLVDGSKPGKQFQRSTSYAEQLDLHDPSQTIIALLEMETIADCIIGTPEFGLTVEQRKRVTIGVELAAKPELLLFLDEPTSGLDSQSAYNIVRFLKKSPLLAKPFSAPSTSQRRTLENFDRLLLLQRGGRTVYFGDIGRDAEVLRSYLKSHGAVAKPTDTAELANVKDTISQMRSSRQAAAKEHNPDLEKEYASPQLHQLKIVIHRMNLSFGAAPLHLHPLQYKVFVMFQVTVLPALIISQVEVMYHIKRAIFFRESSSKMYNPTTFAASIVLAEMPYSIMCAVAFFVLIYFLPGFQVEPSRAGYQFLMILITELFSVTLGQMLASLTPSAFISSQFDPFIMITFALFCGVAVPPPQMPAFWRAWLYQLDPFTRLIGGMVTTALHELEVICKGAELNPFNAPSGQNCGEYMSDFFANGGAGYIVDNSTSECQYCAFEVGDEFYTPLGFGFDKRWRDMGIFLAFFASNIVIIFLGARFLNFNRR